LNGQFNASTQKNRQLIGSERSAKNLYSP